MAPVAVGTYMADVAGALTATYGVRMALYARAQRSGKAAGAACKDVEARKTRMAAPVSFGRWFGGFSLRRPSVS
jgi:crotonobetainyl-CoA:carnitine CoA-transferase CaiB-like acyl-CoA transferase